MSKQKKAVKMVSAIALHDLSYIDHEGQPQYHRQGSARIEIDKDNFDFFLGRNAVKKFDDAAAESEVEEDFEDDFSETEADANTAGDASEANANVAGDGAEAAVNAPKGNTLSLKGGKK